MPQQQTDQACFPASSPRWERARLAGAYDAAAESLWAQITESCQRALARPARIQAAIAAVLALFERDPDLARLLVLTAPGSAQAGLGDKHRLLQDHLVDLLLASLPKGSQGAHRREGAREAIERAFELIAARLAADGARGIGELAGAVGRTLETADRPVLS